MIYGGTQTMRFQLSNILIDSYIANIWAHFYIITGVVGVFSDILTGNAECVYLECYLNWHFNVRVVSLPYAGSGRW